MGRELVKEGEEELLCSNFVLAYSLLSLFPALVLEKKVRNSLGRICLKCIGATV